MKNAKRVVLKRRCVICGTWFAPKAGKQKTCGAVCSAEKDRRYKRVQGQERRRSGIAPRWETYARSRAQAESRTEGVSVESVMRVAAREMSMG